MFAVLGPTFAAFMLVGRESGRAGMGRLLRRALATGLNKRWWLPTLLLFPAFGLLTTGILSLLATETAVFNLPNGETTWLGMDLTQHLVRLQTSYGGLQAFDMQAGLTGTEFGDQVLTCVADLGLTGEYARDKFENDDPHKYDPAQASSFFTVLTTVYNIVEAHRATLTGKVGSIQLWPHGFDLSFEWFGTRIESHVEHGELQEIPSQLNLGFYPGGEPYFYSNPWPFEAKLPEANLPDSAYWHTEGWQGAVLPYAQLVEAGDAGTRLSTFARTVHTLASPTLTT